MEILNGILTRRSIRKYTDEAITREKVEELIKDDATEANIEAMINRHI